MGVAWGLVEVLLGALEGHLSRPRLGWRGKQVGSIQSTGSACSDTQPGCQQQRQIKFQPILDY